MPDFWNDRSTAGRSGSVCHGVADGYAFLQTKAVDSRRSSCGVTVSEHNTSLCGTGCDTSWATDSHLTCYARHPGGRLSQGLQQWVGTKCSIAVATRRSKTTCGQRMGCWSSTPFIASSDTDG